VAVQVGVEPSAAIRKICIRRSSIFFTFFSATFVDLSTEKVIGRLKETQRTLVGHVGIFGDFPGGMAQVVNQYLTWRFESFQQVGILTTRRKRDPLSALLVPLALLRIIALARKRESTRLVFHLSEGGSFVREGLLLVVAWTLGIRSFAHIHGAEFEQYFKTHRPLVCFVLRRAVSTLCLTKDTKQLLESHGLVSTIAKNPVQIPIPSGRPKKKSVLFCGELSLRKGIDTLLAAWMQIENKTNWQLLVAGPIRWAQWPSTLPDDVIYLGEASHAEVLDLCNVLPSRDEALPMFLLEAMAACCAVVSSEVGEIPRLLADNRGILIKPGMAAPLAAGLESLMNDPDLLSETAKKGFEHVSEVYKSEIVAKELSAIWLGN
jgi:glycosyltransferase involved in cell wall biosynthesis